MSPFRRATPDDLPAIKAFLNTHVETSMFPLSNLENHGFEGAHSRSVGFYISHKTSEISDVLTITTEGMVMPQLLSEDYASAAYTLKNHNIIGIIGPKNQARGLQNALGLNSAPVTLDEDEPQFILALDQLIIPKGRGELVPLKDAPEAIIINWMVDYQINALSTPPDQARAQAEQSYASYIANNSHAALMEGDTPLAMTGFNAQLADIVQIGGVYTPPALRSQGLARRALALHLAQARTRGVTRATLFASGPPAIKAYESIGFTRIGAWTLLLFDGPQRA